MDNATYTTLTRVSGLRNELNIVAQNLANVATDGYQRGSIVFSEYVRRLEDPDSSLSMATAHGRALDRTQGQLTQTGGRYDFAIEGDGYFQLETADGQQLTRAGSFQPNAAGELTAPDGARLLDLGGAPVVVPQGSVSISLGADGTLSVDGAPVAQIGVVSPIDPQGMQRAQGVRFIAAEGTVPVETPRLVQGFLESSNVEAVIEVARLIEVQRAYESGRSLLDTEDERIRNVVRTLGQ